MTKFIKLILLSFILSAAFQSNAQKVQKSYEMRDLAVLIGIWECNAEFTVDSVLHKTTYRMNFRKTADGYGINMDEAFTDSALGSLRGANLIGYGYNDSTIHWYCVDNMGNTYERKGKWVDSDNLHFDSNTTRDGKKYSEVITYAFRGTNEFLYKHLYYIDGKEVKKIRGTFKRRQPANPMPKQ